MTTLAPPLEERNETPLERCDRHLAELMQEVRVAQTGVQVLFGFLLTVPFTPRFDALTGNERALYFATLVMAGAAAMLLIAPTSHHRILFRCGDKPQLVRTANRYAIAGSATARLAAAPVTRSAAGKRRRSHANQSWLRSCTMRRSRRSRVVDGWW